MKVSDVCKNYFSGFQEACNYKKNDCKTTAIAVLKIFSYFTLIMPLIFGTLYGVATLIGRVSANKPTDGTTKKTEGVALKTINQTAGLPKVTDPLPQGFFIDVLNKRGYALNDEVEIYLPEPEKPHTFSRNGRSFDEALGRLRDEFGIDDKIYLCKRIDVAIEDLSTEQAISTSKYTTIAINFANEHSMGGAPGFHKNPATGQFVFDQPSTKAQEESICQKSDLMASLTQLPHTLHQGPRGDHDVRSMYSDPFDSRVMAYTSANYLFAVQGDKGFHDSKFLEDPKKVVFVTSAAKKYGDEAVDCTVGSDAYNDAKLRIETHLLAAAFRAGQAIRANPAARIELILGAFGCGAFAPKQNPTAYRAMIAGIYKELGPQFRGFFDLVTFALPTFKATAPNDPAVANHRVFHRVLTSKK